MKYCLAMIVLFNKVTEKLESVVHLLSGIVLGEILYGADAGLALGDFLGLKMRRQRSLSR